MEKLCFDQSSVDIYMQSLVETSMQMANNAALVGFVVGLVVGAVVLYLGLMAVVLVRSRKAEFDAD